MTFTDDDLKRLEFKYCSGHPSERDQEMEALLARLEAAEKCIQYLVNEGYQNGDEIWGHDPFITRYERWRKAAGRTE